jgi:hypothetical protein
MRVPENEKYSGMNCIQGQKSERVNLIDFAAKNQARIRFRALVMSRFFSEFVSSQVKQQDFALVSAAADFQFCLL